MTRTKMHVVESSEDYLVEEQIEQQNCIEPVPDSSDLQVITSNVEESFTDSDDDNDEAVTRGTKDHKKRKLKDIWNLPRGKRIVVKCNDLDQPIGKEAKHLGNFLGTIARNGSLCSLSYKDWRLLIGEKDIETDERVNLKAILDQVKMRFLYPARLEPYILKTIRDRWRQHKSDLKAQHFHEKKSIEANYNNCPKGVSPDQWRALVNNWTSQKAKDISAQNRDNCGKRKSTHTAGTKSFSRHREELREQDPEKKYPHRAVLYIHTHKPRSKNNKNINGHVEELKGILKDQPELADNSQGKTAWKGDALNIVLGDETSGHVHGLGLVPNPNKVFDVSTSRRFQNTHFTSLEDIPNEAMLAFRVELEKLGQHVNNQDSVIVSLKEKIRNLEREPNQTSSDPAPTLGDAPPSSDPAPTLGAAPPSSDPVPKVGDAPPSSDRAPTIRDDPPVDGHYLKRKRVYGTSPSKQLPMVQEPNNLMIKHTGSHGSDSQRSNKQAAPDKNKETLVANGNARQGEKNPAPQKNKEMDSQNNDKPRLTRVSTSDKHDILNKKKSKGTNAALLSNKQQSGSLGWLDAGSLAVGTTVFLKSLSSGNKDVAIGTIVSCDPKYKLDGVEITNQFWAVHVTVAFVKTEELVRKRKNCTLLGNAEGTKIAWPSTFIQKING